MMGYISSSDDAKTYREILALVSTVYRPVSVDKLQSLTRSIENINREEVLEVIAAYGSLLTLRDSIIFFVHQSAKDFLLDKIFANSLDLLGTLKRDIYDLRNPGYPISQVETPSPDPLASIRYSCVYWADHLQDAGDVIQTAMHGKSVVTDTLRFLKTTYLYWLEALSLMHSIPEGVKAIQKLERVLASTAFEELQNLAKDARRFLLWAKGGIELSPLQMYTSALIFSPSNSLIKKLFYKEFPGWIDLAPKVEADWDACLQTLEGHSDSVSSVAISTDGHRLASGSDDNTIKLWDAESGDCLQTLNVGRVIRYLSFDPDHHSRLLSDIGDIIFDPSSTDSAPLIQGALLTDSNRTGYGISANNLWITYEGDNLIWLPPDYRPSESRIAGSTIAIGCGSGRVWVIRFADMVG